MKLENKSISQLKKTLWDYLSPLIRLRGASDLGFNVCVTCGQVRHYKQMDAGHFIAGRRNYTFADPQAIWVQCKPCNGSFLYSAPKDVPKRYKKFMVEKFGKKFVEEMIKKNRKPVQFEKKELIEMIHAAKKDLKEYEKVYQKIQTSWKGVQTIC